jgi:DNA-binding response OmpR family regulator
MKLLIAEDDRALALFLSRGLEADGHRVRLVHDGAAAEEAFLEEMPDLTILDLNMPVKDGEQVLQTVRAVDSDLPILILTARHELRARCRALLRRSRDARLRVKIGSIELDRLDHTVQSDGRPVVLTNKEFALLEYLMLRRGTCVSRVELLDAVWNLEPTQTTNIVDVYINYLRRKLHDPTPGQFIRTVRGQGYLVSSNPESTMAGFTAPLHDSRATLRIPSVSVPVAH